MNENIDKIFEYLSWYEKEDVQKLGLRLASEIKHMSVLIMPVESKSTWQNCAKVLATKSDEELGIYYFELLKWLQDMNWPGAEIIYDRLLCVSHSDEYFLFALKHCTEIATLTNDLAWKRALDVFCSEYSNQKINTADS